MRGRAAGRKRWRRSDVGSPERDRDLRDGGGRQRQDGDRGGADDQRRGGRQLRARSDERGGGKERGCAGGLRGGNGGGALTWAPRSATGTFATAAVGSGKTVTVAGLTISGGEAANYA